MTKYIFIFLLLTTFKLQAQQNCPAGYEERTVKCNGQFVKKCIPVNYTCSQCWAVSFPPCPNRKSGGLDFFSTYEKALARAQSEKNKKWYCSDVAWWDNHNPTIYLDESKFCNASNGNVTALNDLKNKIIPFLKRYKAEISNYNRYFSGKPYKPGAIVKEYKTMLKQAEENVKKLENYLNNITDKNLSEIETAFNDIQNEEVRLQQTHSSYESYVNNSPNGIANNTLSRPNTLSSPPKNSNNADQLQNQLHTINQQYQTKRENNERLFNTLQTGIQDIANILSQNAQRKEETRHKQYEAEREWRRQQLQVKIAEERKKQEEEDKKTNEIARQFSIDSIVLSFNFKTKKTNSINETLDSVYYIGYKRKYDDQEYSALTLKLFTVYRYSDGTFPLFSAVVEKSKHENNIAQQGISLLIGFFPTKEATLNAIAEIQESAKINGIDTKVDRVFGKINQNSNSKTLDKNFWNQ